MSIERIRKSLRPVAARVYRIPFLGYGAKLLVAFVKLPRINFHLHRIDSEVRLLLETRKAPLEHMPISSDELHARLQELDSSWRHNLPLFLNAVSSVGAFGHKLASIERSLAGSLSELDKKALAIEAGFGSIRDEIAQIKRELLKVAEGDGPIGTQIAHLSSREAELSDAIATNVMSIDRLWERVELIRREFVYQAGNSIIVDEMIAHGEKNNVSRSKEPR